jgi:hypothetical protein
MGSGIIVAHQRAFAASVLDHPRVKLEISILQGQSVIADFPDAPAVLLGERFGGLVFEERLDLGYFAEGSDMQERAGYSVREEFEISFSLSR